MEPNYQALQKTFLKIAKDFPVIGNKLLDVHYGIEIGQITNDEYLNSSKDYLYNLVAEPEIFKKLKPHLFKLFRLLGRIDFPDLRDSFQLTLKISLKLIEIVINNEYAKLKDELKSLGKDAASIVADKGRVLNLQEGEIIGAPLAGLLKLLIEKYVEKMETEYKSETLKTIRIDFKDLVNKLLIEQKRPNLPGFAKETFWLDSVAEIVAEKGSQYTSLEEKEFKTLLKDRFALEDEKEQVLDQVLDLVRIKRALMTIHNDIYEFDPEFDKSKRTEFALNEELLEKISADIGKDARIKKRDISNIAEFLFKRGYHARNMTFPMLYLIYDLAEE